MDIIFTKMHGLGNDFVVIDTLTQDVSLDENFVRDISNRHTGIGCDQILLVGPADEPHVDFSYRIFNADGTEVAQCGNGARCVAAFVRDKGFTDKTTITLKTKERLLTATLQAPSLVTVDMGQPLFDPEKIPFLTNTPALSYTLTIPGINQPLSMVILSMGNPHAVITIADIQQAPVEIWGKLLQQQAVFPESVNVGFMQIQDSINLKLRVYERGVGETSACGSGACAAAIAAIMQGLTESPVKVTLPGGSLTITWQGNGHSVRMTGPAIKVFSGVFSREN